MTNKKKIVYNISTKNEGENLEGAKKMKVTIKAKDGYKVIHEKNDKNNIFVLDGDEILFNGRLRTWEDFEDEVKNGNNEMAFEMEVFITTKWNKFVHWVDLETDEDFITTVTNEKK